MIKKLIVLLIINSYSTQVLELNNRNFFSEIENNDYLFVEFYSDNCYICKEYENKYEDFEEKFNKEFGVKFARVDYENSSKVKKQYKIHNYPTIVLFIKGKPSIYLDDINNYEEFKEFYLKRKTPNVETISSMKKFNKYLNNNKCLIVYAGSSLAFIKLVEEASLHFGYYKFIIVQDNDLMTKIQAKVDYIGVYRNRFEHHTYTPTSSLNNFDDILKFIKSYTRVFLEPFDKYVLKSIFHQKKNAVLYFDESSYPNFELAFNFSSDLKEKNGLFTKIDIDSYYGKMLEKELGVDRNNLPEFILISHKNNNIVKYKYKGKLERDEIKKFIDEFENQELTPFYRSEDIKPNTNNNYLEVVGKNFDELIIDSNKEYLVLNYTSWCEVCKHLKSFLLNIKNKYNNLNLAFFNGELNDSQYLDMQTFPAIYYFNSSDKKNPVIFKEQISEVNIEKFIKDNLKNQKSEL